MTHGDIERVVLSKLGDDPTSESDLRRLMAAEGLTSYQTSQAIARLQARNEIRWVAFAGWAKGGRPT